jgi:hypothetical protein
VVVFESSVTADSGGYAEAPAPAHRTRGLPLSWTDYSYLAMLVYALASSQSPRETVDLFLTQEAAEAELSEILEDEPEWVDTLSASCRSNLIQKRHH